jgi:hypothetical protein
MSWESATMTSESGVLDPYELVLADLRAKRDQIDQTIRLLESLRGLSTDSPLVAAVAANVSRGPSGSPYLGMSIAEAAKKLLETERRAIGNAEIAEKLRAGGLVMTSVDPLNTIGSILTRRFYQIGDIVRVSRGKWGLKDWYPNRSFAKAKGVATGEPKSGTNEPSPPPSLTPAEPPEEDDPL